MSAILPFLLNTFRMRLISNRISRGLDHNRLHHNCVQPPKISPLPPFCFWQLVQRQKALCTAVKTNLLFAHISCSSSNRPIYGEQSMLGNRGKTLSFRCHAAINSVSRFGPSVALICLICQNEKAVYIRNYRGLTWPSKVCISIIFSMFIHSQKLCILQK